MAKPKQTLEEPLRSKLEAALAHNTRRTRTLATLQKHLTEGTILQVLDTLTAIANGTITEHELPRTERLQTPRAEQDIKLHRCLKTE